MTFGSLVWIIIFFVSAVTFFSLAAVIAFLGFKDLRELLRQSGRGKSES